MAKVGASEIECQGGDVRRVCNEGHEDRRLLRVDVVAVSESQAEMIEV